MIHPHMQTSATLARQREIQARCFHPMGAFIEFTKEAAQGSIPVRFEQQARRHSHRLAFKSRSRELTYDQLNQAANRLAWAILERQGPGQEPVALLVEQDAAMVIGILGIWKAGKVYVALDPTIPQSRNSYILEDSQARLVVTNRRNLGLAKELVQNGRQAVNLDQIDSESFTGDVGLPLTADSFAYIMYTSGSTGQPKGVIQSHGGLLWDARKRTNAMHICPEDGLTLLTASNTFAVHVMLLALLNGAALHSFNVKEEGAAGLTNWIRREGITVAMLAPPVFRSFAGTLTGVEEFPRLRFVRLSSDSVRRQDVELYQQFLPAHCILVNSLTSTEAGCMAQYFMDHETELSGDHVPVGYPPTDTEVLLLDEEGREVEPGQAGEMAIRSPSIASGYWRGPELTQAKFRPDPQGGDGRIFFTGDLGRRSSDGCLFHLGRKDFQVTVRGYRVELAEIELALSSIANVKEAAVLAVDDQSGNRRLVAYVVPREVPGPSVTSLRRALEEKLPSHMVPSAFVILEALPLLPGGKVNRLALPAPDKARPELGTPFIAPRTPEEEKLAQIWAQVLGLDRVGMDDNFLELGGDSLLATQVISRVIKAFSVDLPQRSLFSAPTVAQMTVVVAQRQAQQASPEDVERLLAEVEALSEDQAKQLLTGPSSVPQGKAHEQS